MCLLAQTRNEYKLLGPSKFPERTLAQGKVSARSVGMLSDDGQTMTEDHTEEGRTPLLTRTLIRRMQDSVSDQHVLAQSIDTEVRAR